MSKKLTIGVVTMNRDKKLKNALTSCLSCQLPKETEFVVIDNASSDNTHQIVDDVLGKSGYSYTYYFSEKNLGAGGGRNLYFEKAKGEYVYGMDDDAIIDSDNNPDFFMKAINRMDNYPRIATLATQIFDEMWNENRQKISGNEVYPGIYQCRMFCGGSHFLRRDIFQFPPYLSNRYGYEELPPSLMVYDMKYINAFCPDLLSIHQPTFNKWDYTDKRNLEQLIMECSSPYVIKLKMYPRIFYPALWAANECRCYRYLPKGSGNKKKVKDQIKQAKQSYKIEYTLRVNTIFRMIRDFGLATF